MPHEIERKFLVNQAIWQPPAAGLRCRQGYIPTTNATTVRVRIMGEQGYITFKGPSLGLTRSEYEYEIPTDEASEMLDHFCEASLVEKTRYKVLFAGLTWEIDVFAGANHGLILAEIELTSETQAVSLPPWVGEEVSHDPRYRNAYLAQHPYGQW